MFKLCDLKLWPSNIHTYVNIYNEHARVTVLLKPLCANSLNKSFTDFIM